MNILFRILCVVLFVVLATGCGQETDPFTGTWENVDQKNDLMIISKSGSLYTITLGSKEYHAQRADYKTDLISSLGVQDLVVSYREQTGFLTTTILDNLHSSYKISPQAEE
jgi:hypothetical protein